MARGSALDAVTRGLRVGLVEARDYASGTSSRSSKLFHGGLRYLEQFDVRLVFEALKERSLVLNRLCPHLARPVPFIYPLRRPVVDRAYAGLGIGVYDLMGAGRGVPHHLRHLSRTKTMHSFPSGKRDAIHGSIRFYEGLVDDARHTMMLARTAAAYGALVANSTRVIGFVRESDRVAGVRVRDLESGAEFDIAARQVINAAGVWTDEIQHLVGGRGQFQVRASKGIHIVIPRNRINSATGIITRTEKSLLFIIPWGSHWIIGTTDTDWNHDLAHPAASRSDIDYVLEHANALLADPITADDVVGVYAGLRPLLSGESESTSKLSREHAVASPVRGLTVIAGGKYTTYRVMAQDAVNAAVHGLERTVPASCTEDIPLLGAEGYFAVHNNRHRIAGELGLPVVDCRTSARPVRHALPRTRGADGRTAGAARAVGRRTRIPRRRSALRGQPRRCPASRRHPDPPYPHLDRGARPRPDGRPNMSRGLRGRLLGWSAEAQAREIEHYRQRVAAERESQDQLDDQTADASRLGAPEVRASL